MSDAELLRAWRRGDRRAGSTLFNRYFDSILRFFRTKVDDAVEDLVQQTFTACVETRDRFREESSFRTYLYAIAHNVLREFYRRRRRFGRYVNFEVESVVDLGAGPVTLAVAHAEQRLLLEALRRIPIAHQVILELYFWERFTGKEMGAFLDVTEDTVRSRLRRVKAQLIDQCRALEIPPNLLDTTLTDLDRWAESIREILARKLNKAPREP